MMVGRSIVLVMVQIGGKNGRKFPKISAVTNVMPWSLVFGWPVSKSGRTGNLIALLLTDYAFSVNWVCRQWEDL